MLLGVLAILRRQIVLDIRLSAESVLDQRSLDSDDGVLRHADSRLSVVHAHRPRRRLGSVDCVRAFVLALLGFGNTLHRLHRRSRPIDLLLRIRLILRDLRQRRLGRVLIILYLKQFLLHPLPQLGDLLPLILILG